MAVLKRLLQIGGADARNLAEIKRRRIGYTLSIYFGVATTQMPRLSSAFANRRYRYEARAQINRRHVQKYTSVYIFELRVCKANTLLTRTTAIRGGFDTLRIFSSGTDAAGYIRSDVSAMLKLAAKSVQGCTLLDSVRDRSGILFAVH